MVVNGDVAADAEVDATSGGLAVEAAEAEAEEEEQAFPAVGANGGS